MIRRGTTPAFKVTVKSSSPSTTVEDLMELIEDFYITFQQGRRNSITKHGEDLVWSPDGVSFYLTQEETLSFAVGSIDIQVRCALPGDKAIASEVKDQVVERILNEEVI